VESSASDGDNSFMAYLLYTGKKVSIPVVWLPGRVRLRAGLDAVQKEKSALLPGMKP
jgi:hypothetical protein